MSIRPGSAYIHMYMVRRVSSQTHMPVVDLPAFLCPAWTRGQRQISSRQRQLHSTSATTPLSASVLSKSLTPGKCFPPQAAIINLPQQCPGCGAFSQILAKNEPGFYSLKRRSVNDFLKGIPESEMSEEDALVKNSLRAAIGNDPGLLHKLHFTVAAHRSGSRKVTETPFCERCHNLRHHDTGVSIHHPSMQSIQDTIYESPYKYNHVYHVIDAADFPMSLISGLHKLLHLTPQRSLNRRSKSGKFYHGKKTEISFIITRSDLLAPKKEQVDSMMPYLRSVLRDALGRAGNDVRLGNVRCVSAKQGWWTKELKEEIWKRGGGGWMVGKVNVGKSQLFREVFPKGRRANMECGKPVSSAAAMDGLEAAISEAGPDLAKKKSSEVKLEDPAKDLTTGSLDKSPKRRAVVLSEEHLNRPIPSGPSQPQLVGAIEEVAADRSEEMSHQEIHKSEFEYMPAAQLLGAYSILPPAQPETDYPKMPLFSSLPGTTASPIRVPFGNGKGELIDLPGLSRGELELHVQPQHRPSLVMRARVLPEQKVIKPGQSLLLGGFIRITPTTPDVIFLAYAFNPLKAHLTSTEKAIGIQTNTQVSSVENIALPATAEKLASAGTFQLKWDVTKQRTGPLTARDAAGVKVERLPYRVFGTDILIEGVGWVELVAQVRKRPSQILQDNEEVEDTWEWEQQEKVDPDWPALEVFTPEGKFIASRKPLNAWSFVAQKPSARQKKARPRRAMKGVKKLRKIRARFREVPL